MASRTAPDSRAFKVAEAKNTFARYHQQRRAEIDGYRPIEEFPPFT
jgi:hypothetical protein